MVERGTTLLGVAAHLCFFSSSRRSNCHLCAIFACSPAFQTASRFNPSTAVTDILPSKRPLLLSLLSSGILVSHIPDFSVLNKNNSKNLEFFMDFIEFLVDTLDSCLQVGVTLLLFQPILHFHFLSPLLLFCPAPYLPSDSWPLSSSCQTVTFYLLLQLIHQLPLC